VFGVWRIEDEVTNEEQTPMAMWAIYENPIDFPAGYVLRKWLIGDEGTVHPGPGSRHSTLSEARAALPPGVERAPGPSVHDDPTVIEIWW
jgi:hypothetical protein